MTLRFDFKLVAVIVMGVLAGFVVCFGRMPPIQVWLLVLFSLYAQVSFVAIRHSWRLPFSTRRFKTQPASGGVLMRLAESVERFAARRLDGIVAATQQSYMDSQPVKLYEYMSAGLPVIASDFPRWAPLIDGCGVAVAPRRPAEIANAIFRLLEGPAEAEAMGQRGRARVIDVYNWRSEEKRLLDLYNAVLNRSGRTDEAAAMVERTPNTI